MVRKYLSIKCGKHKCKLVKEKFTSGNIDEEDFVCPQCIEELKPRKSYLKGKQAYKKGIKSLRDLK